MPTDSRPERARRQLPSASDVGVGRRVGGGTLTALTLVLLGFMSGARADTPDTWLLFRGDAQLTGIASGELPVVLQPKWVFEADDSIESTAAIANGVVYVGSLDAHLYALDLETGAEKWRHAAAAEIKSSPTIVGNVVYFGDESGAFTALDAESGALVWQAQTGGGVVSSANFYEGSGRSEDGDDAALIFGSYDNHLYSVSVADGSVNWKIETGGYVNGTPAIVDDRVISVGCDGYLRVVRATDGEVLSQIEIGAYVAASPAISNGHAYFGTYENQVLSLDLETGLADWIYEHPVRKFPFYSSAAITDDVIVLGGRDKMVHAIDRTTGESRWTVTSRARVDSSPVIMGERVFVGSSSGDLYELDLESGATVWTFETGSSIAASPSIASGKLVIGTEDGQLYCFG